LKLRQWQLTCLDNAFNHYLKGANNFLVFAVPGAGKTILAASIAKRMLENDLVDIIISLSPSVSIKKNIQDVLSISTNRCFKGEIGSAGICFTYQSLSHISPEFWRKIRNKRKFLILDEVHHCSGNNEVESNHWGLNILQKISQGKTYSLSLSGTPWRTDSFPITKQQYSRSSSQIAYHYKYGLQDAIKDGICRIPKVILIDNEQITVEQRNGKVNTFSNFEALLSDSEINYQAILENKCALKFILKESITKLEELRAKITNAGGLIVATSVNHAYLIAETMRKEFSIRPQVVTYKQHDAQIQIDEYKQNTKSWLISVGMVSEGTDIPRLQICCYLSRIRTELYFRQVLGRILRATNDKPQQAWLFTFAEPNLIKFAERLNADIPFDDIIEKRQVMDIQHSVEELKNTQSSASTNEISYSFNSASLSLKVNDNNRQFDLFSELKFSDQYRKKLVDSIKQFEH